MATDRRSFSRTPFDASIRLSKDGSDTEIESTMIDYSPGGIGCRANREIPPNSNVSLEFSNDAVKGLGIVGGYSFKSKVCWMERCDSGQGSYILLGLQFLSEGHDIEKKFAKIKKECDLCGASQANLEMIPIPLGAELCRNCYEHYQSIPEGPMKVSIGRFLLYNVI